VNFHEAQERGKTFHYAWLMLLIVMVAWEVPEDSEFYSIVQNLLEAVKYNSFWATKDT